MDWLLIGPLIGTFALSMAVSWILTACHIRLGRDFGLIDNPSERKFHKRPTPTAAGLALYLTIVVSSFALRPRQWSLEFIFAGLIVIVGLLDDIRPLWAQLRLVIHALIVVPAMFLLLPKAAWEFQAAGCLWVLVLIHAFNFIDNMDGLCAGVAWILAACLAVCSVLCPQSSVLSPSSAAFTFPPLLLLMGALTGFLWFNRPPARVFMGDAGSTFLGFFLGVASVPLFLEGEESPRLSADWLAPLCMFALPIYDLVSVATLRVWQRRGLFVSDRNNLSHRLVALGMRPTRAVALLWLLAVVGGVGGLLLYVVPDPAKTILGAAQLAGWWVALPVAEYLAQRRLATLRRSVESRNASTKRR
jgi:UDP-GlcNAc:undecaprenyl-phosphate GlcNAc-1-phosphate transferase